MITVNIRRQFKFQELQAALSESMESTVPTDTDSLNEDVVVETRFNDSITMSTNTERIDVISQKVQTDTIPQRIKTSIDVGT